MTYVPCDLFCAGDRVRSHGGTVEGVIADFDYDTANVRTADGTIIPVDTADLDAWQDSPVNATRSWNLAIVTLGVCLAAFLASVIATTTGWHSVATGRAAASSALAMVGCGVWLHLAAARLGPLEPEPGDDEEAGTP